MIYKKDKVFRELKAEHNKNNIFLLVSGTILFLGYWIYL